MADSKMSILTKGIVKENPVLRLVLGTCPTLAVTTAAANGVGMGVAATLVLLGSNVAISLLRKVIPDKVRIPAYITIIATFVTIIQMLVKAFAPSIDKSLGIFLPLIVVNCIILARAEMFASKNSVLPSILDALGMGIGFTAALTLMGMIRELLGTGCIFGLPVTQGAIDPMIVFILPPGGFFVFGILVALSNKLAVRAGKKPVKSVGCGGSCNGCAGCAASEQIAEKRISDANDAGTAEAVGETVAEADTASITVTVEAYENGSDEKASEENATKVTENGDASECEATEAVGTAADETVDTDSEELPENTETDETENAEKEQAEGGEA